MMSEYTIWLDPVTGETIKEIEPSTSISNHMRGPYHDELGQEYYIQMIQVWPVPKESEKRRK